MIKHFTDNINTNILISAALNLGLDYHILDAGHALIKISKDNNCIYIKKAMIGINDTVSSIFAKYKYLSLEIFKKNNIPTPSHILIDKKNYKNVNIFVKELLNIIKSDFSLPIVIKPNDGICGHNVYANLNTIESIKSALNDIFYSSANQILIESYVPGKNYRILTFNNEIIEILERIPAHVVGDGNHTIFELINEYNKFREQAGAKIIDIDTKLKTTLQNNNFKLDTILSKNQVVKLRENCNFAEGGETKRIKFSEVHVDNIELWEKIAKTSLNLKVNGIDFICPDISISYKKQVCCVNEINASPCMDVHYFADWSKSLEAPKKILKMYFNLK